MVRRIFARAAAASLCGALLLLGTGCAEDNPAEPAAVTLAEVQASVFDQSCIGCHSGTVPAGDLDLTDAAAYGALVNVASSEVPELLRVEPGNAEDSYLYIKIVGGDRMAPGTFQMPIGDELPSDQIELVQAWIDEGAEP